MEELRLHYGLPLVEAPVKAGQLPAVTAGIFAVPDRAAAAAALDPAVMVAGPATPVSAPGTAGDGDTDRDSDWPPVEAMDFPRKTFLFKLL